MPEPESRALAYQQAHRARRQYWSLWILAGLALLAVIAKLFLNIHNAALERDMVEKQQFVSQTVPISRLNVQLVQGIANVAARTGDPALQDLLAKQGIQFEVSNAK